MSNMHKASLLQGYLYKGEKAGNFDDFFQKKSYNVQFDQFFDENKGEFRDLHGKEIKIERDNN